MVRFKTPDGFASAYKAMGEAGWTAMEAAEEFGGQHMPMAVSAAVNEMWQSASLSFALCQLANTRSDLRAPEISQ